MADNGMLSLFDTDGGFLDDLASDNGMTGSGPLMDGGMLGPGNNMQMNPMQQPQMFNQQMGGIPPGQFSNMPMQSHNMPQQNQFMGNNFNQNAFNTTKLHHFGGAVQQQPVSGTHIMVLQQNSQPRPQQQAQMQVGFSGYGGMASPGPRLPNPHQQQMGIPQNIPGMWNPNQNGPSGPSFIQQLPNQQPHMQNVQQQQQMPGNGLQTTYLAHHEYALPNDNGVQQNLYQDNMTSTQNANVFMQGLKSPPTNIRPNVPTMSSPNNLGSKVSNMGQSPGPQQQIMINRSIPFQQSQNMNSVNIQSFNTSQKQQNFQNNFSLPNVQNVGQINSSGSVSVPSSSFQTYTYQQMPNQNSMGSGIQMSQNVNDKSSNIIPFQNTSPNQNVQFRPGYAANSSQRTTTRSVSPRPIPSPACTPDQNAHTSPNSQVNNNQLVSPTLVSRGNATPAASPYHPVSRSDTNIPASQTQVPANSYVTLNSSNNISLNSNQGNLPNQLISVSVSQPTVNNVGPMSPNVGQGKNVNIEIYQLQQQIQQIHNQPQTQQTQQQMLDLQERVRTLRAQQEINNQRQKQQQAQPQQFSPYQVNHQQMQPNSSNTTIIQVQQQQQPLQARQQIVQIQQQFPNQQPQQAQPGQGQKILLLSNSVPGQPPRFFQTMSHPQGQQFGQQQQKVLLIQQQQPQPGQQMRIVSQGQPQQMQNMQNQMPPSSMAMGNAHVPMSVVQIQLPQKTEMGQQALLPKIDMDGDDKSMQKVKAQEKANQIVAEAVAKAQAAGNLQIPKVVTPPPIPSTVGDAEGPGSEDDGKKKSAKKRAKKRAPKTPKEKKDVEDTDGESKEKKAKVEKPKSVKKKKKPPATFLKSKKRKRHGSSDGSDVEIKITPPPSPENDDEGIQKRRSARNTKRKKYHDEVDLNLSEEEPVDVEAESVAAGGAVLKPVQYLSVDSGPALPPEEESLVVEKILGVRMRKLDKDIDVVNDEEETQPEEEVEEFFVKYKNYSYLHCEWKTIAELERDKRIHMKIKRFRQKRDHANYFETVDEDELFNPDYVEVDRVLEVSITSDPNTNEEITHFLVKWRGLPYEDSTWELQQDVDPEKVKLFYKYKELPPEEERQIVPRPSRDDWKKIPESKEYKGGNSLREYQLEGVNWLTFNWYKHQNCILADEMGLGKTVQSITFLNEIVEYGIVGPFLVVVPLSTLGNWQREFETWTDLNVIVYHGSNASKFMLQEYEMFHKDENNQRVPDYYKFSVLVTTFEIIISDCELLSSIDWRCLIIDEAHRLKNKKCKLMEGLKFVDCEHRVLLTGTPLQNNVEELFSLLNFLEPEQFNSSQAFLTEFGNLKTDDQVDKLKALLKPMMLRRLKEDVEKNLAAKEETIIEVELTNIQKKYYRAILERNFAFLSKGSTTSANVPNLLNTMMELRKCCNHPYLVKGAEDMIIMETKEKERKSELDVFDVHKLMVNSSGKLVLLDKLLPKLKQNGHKVLIFSQMIKVLDILEDYLIHRRYLYERLDGRITGIMRQEAIDRFSKPDSDRFVFLLCTRAGGLGINLTAADTVIIYDSDWNPQNDLQAQARCHRIGQSKAVKVYRLITRNSYEREMFDRASLKLGLDKAVLQSMGGEKSANPQAQMSKKEIEELLRKGAYGALMDDDHAGDDFCEEDIDQILQRRTQVIQIESEGKGSTFAKASFTMSENRTDIDINDPNFWQKWAKKADVDMDQDKNELIVEEPRMRKQTTRYGNDDGAVDMSELESSTDEDGGDDEEEGVGRGRGRGRKGRKGRRRGRGSDDDFDAHGAIGELYSRSECFKVEKNLLVFGWGRWSDIISHGRFKRTLTAKDVETISRALLMYSLKVYKGDEKIKEFIWDLISPSNDGSLRNHSGLSAPVPRGRKGKNKTKKENKESEHEMAMAKFDIDPETILKDSGYKRHLHRHANKVLLRVRLLYYLREEIIGNSADKINKGLDVSEIELPRANVEGEPPTLWWDELADRSLLIGVFKHGYEKYNLMRQDPLLCFLSRCGPPDGAALAAEQNDDDDEDLDDTKANASALKDDVDEDTCTSVVSSQDSTVNKEQTTSMAVDGDEEEKLPWPTMSDLNTRLRRIITSFQRNHKRQMLKDAQRAKRMERREKYDIINRYKEDEKIQYHQSFFGCWESHWTRREETDFYRIISTFGVEFDLYTGRYKWDRFRTLARLEKKHDDTLTEYFQAFYHMCMRVCKKFKNDDDALPPNNIYVEPISEERASRSLARIDLLNKIRTETLAHPKLDDRVKLCQTSYDLPSWWICGKHDKDLLRGAARHGVVRTDEFILNDPALSFKDVFRNKRPYVNSPHHMQSPVTSQTPSKLKNKEEETELEIKAMIEKIKKESQKDKSQVSLKDVKKEPLSPVKKSDESEMDTEKNKKESSPDSKKNIFIERELKSEEQMESESKSPIKEEVKNEVNDDVKEEKSEEDNDTQKVDNDDEATDIEHDVSDNETSKDVDMKEEIRTKQEKSPVKVKLEEREKEIKEEKHVKKETDALKEQHEKIKVEEGEKFSKEDVELQKLINAEENSEDKPSMIPSDFLQWPKDRVIFHRLEHICYCVETGEWPFPKRMSNIPMNSDSRSATPLGSSTPRDDPDLSHSDAGDSVYDGIKGDGLKMTFHKRKDQKFEGRMAHLLNQSAASSDNDSQSESLTPRSQVAGHSPRHSPHHYFFSQTPVDLLSNGSGPDFDPVLLQRSMMEHALMFPDRRRRGRKRKAEKMAELAMAEALARRHQAKTVAGIDPESRVPVINLEDGSRLSGDEAPQKKELEKWLDEHPGYMVADCEDEDLYDDVPRRGRKPRLDPSMIDPIKMTGEENVSVVNRLTGKKITGAKAPPLKYLTEWLEQNPMYDVDPKWADIVRSKVSLPKTLQSRVMTPSRGRKPKESLSSSLMGPDIPFSAASLSGLSGFPNPSLMSGLHKLPLGMPFGSLPNFGLGNPLLGLAGYLPGLTTHSKDSESSSKDSKSPKSKEKSESKSPSIPHPSFPFMYNPMLLNPLFAAQAQSLGFSLPTSLPTSFGALAHSGLLNGSAGDSDLEEGEIKRYSNKERRSSNSGVQDAPQDLSVKSKHHHNIGKHHHSDKKHASHSSKHDSASKQQYSASLQDEPTDLSMKSKSVTPDSAKSKPKIQSSFKLSKIVDSLKDKVNKMEDKSRKDKKSKLDSILNKLVEEKETVDKQSVDDDSSITCAADLSIASDSKVDDSGLDDGESEKS